MGIYLNPGSEMFEEGLNSQIYVDKTEMLRYVNSVVNSKQKYMCVSRPRRFGKTMATEMLEAYYDRTADSRALFEKCKISQTGDDWDKYLGKFDVIRITMTEFINSRRTINDAINTINDRVLQELHETYPNVNIDKNDFVYSLRKAYQCTKRKITVFIDEWDAVFHMSFIGEEDRVRYLLFLRNLLKDQAYVALAYMTGILPIAKYSSGSELNMFLEYTLALEERFSKYFVFFTERGR